MRIGSHWLPLVAALAAMPIAAADRSIAQVVGIGSTQSGVVSQITATISKVVSESNDGVQMRSQTFGGTQQYIPVVNAGELGFGISNASQYWMAVHGTGLSKGTPYANLRLVSTMMKFSTGFMVRNSSGIKSVAQLKGKRIAAGFKAAPLLVNIHSGGLATAGLTYKDVKSIPAVGMVQHWQMLMEDKVDAVIGAIGSAFIKQMNAKIPGGVRHIAFDSSPEALKRMHEWFPKATWSTIKPAKGLDSIVEPVTLASFDFVLWTHKSAPDDIVYKVTRIMHRGGAKLKEGGPFWRTYPTGSGLCKDQGAPYHPGAVRYFKEAGLCATK